MESNLSTAFTLMLIGVVTVFLMLGVVYILGYLIVKITNMFPDEPVVRPIRNKLNPEISANKLSAIVAAVEITTGGLGKVNAIKKIQ